MPPKKPKRRYPRQPGEVLARLEQALGQGEDDDLLLQMLDGVRKLAAGAAERGDLKMLSHALMEMRRAFHVFAPYRRTRKVSVFGSARTTEDAVEYGMAKEFATRMTRLGFMVITGAGPGIMEAAQGGAGRAHSFGVNIRLPFEFDANHVIQDDPKLVHFKYFFTRKVMFVKEADGIVLFPGGFGTHDEGFESMTLVQTGKSHLIPLVFVDRPGGSYWRDWLAYVEKHLVGGGYISPHDRALFEITDSVDVAVEVIRRFYSNYHSSRFVWRRLVIRLEQPVSDELLDRINVEFADVVVAGKIERLDAPLDEEQDEPWTLDLHRLALEFDRKSFGRLRQLVDVLNDAVGE